MEFKQIKSFIVVAETLSFSKTAEILNFVNPAYQIKSDCWKMN